MLYIAKQNLFGNVHRRYCSSVQFLLSSVLNTTLFFPRNEYARITNYCRLANLRNIPVCYTSSHFTWAVGRYPESFMAGMDSSPTCEPLSTSSPNVSSEYSDTSSLDSEEEVAAASHLTSS